MTGELAGGNRRYLGFFGGLGALLAIAITAGAFAPSASALPTKFFGFQWGVNTTTNDADLEAVERSGAKYWRIGFGCTTSHETMDTQVELAWKHHVTIIANPSDCNLSGENNTQYPTYDPSKSLANQSAKWQLWEAHLKYLVDRYGNGGTFWQGRESTQDPITIWEPWNEPNRGANSPGGFAQPVEYGRFLKRSAEILNNDQGAANVTILMGGLLTLATGYECQGCYWNMNVSEFLEGTHTVSGIGEQFDGVSIHPYAFKPGGGQTVAQKVEQNINNNREAVTNVYSGAKSLWITEAGWPVSPEWKGSEAFPAASESEQASRLDELLYWVESYQEALNLKSFLYYNYRDFDWSSGTNWDNFAGLRRQNGTFRQAWTTFQNHTGAPKWPVPPGAETNGSSGVLPKEATVSSTINPKGLTSAYQIDYGKTTAYGSSTSSSSAGYGSASISKNKTLTGLTPNTTYHYRVAVTNENNETTHGADRTFTTPPSTTTYIQESIEPLNGTPGWVTVKGGVSSPEQLVNNAHVNLEFFKKNGANYEYHHMTEVPVVNGIFEKWYEGVSKGEWEVKAYFPAQGSLGQSSSGYHKFTVKAGYQLVNVNSGKCLDVKDQSTANGASIQQYECLNPAQFQNQVFTLVPQGNYYYQLKVRHSGKCADVDSVSQSNGAWVKQWDCLGSNQTNQIWNGVGVSGGTKFVAKHSGKCMDVFNSGTQNGATVVQWTCSGGANQTWTFKSVESGTVPTGTWLTINEVLNGEPGLLSVSGTVDLSGYSPAGKWVNVKFEKKINGVWTNMPEQTQTISLNGSSQYSKSYIGLGVGEWRAYALYPGEDGILGASSSNTHEFEVRRGYRLKSRYSEKCMSVSENKGNNGQAIIQYDCAANPSPGDGQMFTFVPIVGQWPYNQIKFTSTGKCLDVTGASTSEGAWLQQWDCGTQANQLWKGVGISGQDPWMGFLPKHTEKCMDVMGSSKNNGVRLQQWICLWTSNQQWLIQSVN